MSNWTEYSETGVSTSAPSDREEREADEEEEEAREKEGKFIAASEGVIARSKGLCEEDIREG